MHQFRFRALIALDAAVPGRGVGHYTSPTHALMLRAACLRPPAHHRLFRAKICWADHHALKPGDRAVVTITVADDDAEMFFAAGQRFTIWNGGDIGQGTISRQIFAPPDPGGRETAPGPGDDPRPPCGPGQRPRDCT